MSTASYEFEGAAGRIHVSTWAGEGAPGSSRCWPTAMASTPAATSTSRPCSSDSGPWSTPPDHLGHGQSSGERAVVEDIEVLVGDLHTVADRARADHPRLPVVLVGHSMGGLIAARFAQRYLAELAALVLSGPVVGGNPAFAMLLEMDPIPDIPIDPAILSRDPAVGAAYAADPLVYHGPFHKATLRALATSADVVAAAGTFGDVPTLWIHGAADQLVPYDVTAATMERIRGTSLQHRPTPGRPTRCSTRPTTTRCSETCGDFLTDVLDLD